MFAELSDFPGGWIIGNFAPSLIRSGDFEVAIKNFSPGDYEPRHYQETAVEITVVVSGSCRFAGQTLSAGQIILLNPGEISDFLALTDCTVVCVKSPSIPDDKVVPNEL